MKNKSNYQKWTKIPLTPDLTHFLYDCYYQLSQKEGDLLKSFPNGIFLVKGQEKYLDKLGNLRPKCRKNYPLRRINLSVIQVKGQYHYRIFINYNHIHTKYDRPATNHSMFQLSHKENIFKLDLKFPQDYKGNYLTDIQLTNYLKEHQYTTEYGYKIANYIPTQFSEYSNNLPQSKPKLVKKITLTKQHRIINEWNIIEKYITPYLKNLPNYFCFDSNNTEQDYILLFQEIKAKHHPLTFPQNDIRYLYCRIAHETPLVFDRILHYLINYYQSKYL